MHRNLGIGAWIARRARMTPNRVALITGEQRWTYAELAERITRLARALVGLGIVEGDRVAFLGSNHPAALETLFACGLVGATAVPVHPGFDDASLRQVFADSGARALIFTATFAPAVRRLQSTTAVELAIAIGAVTEPNVLRYEELVADASAEPLDRAIDLSATCLLAFSSGTTGRSKGVVLTHHNVLFNVLNLLSCVDYVRDDVILTSAPLYRMGGLGFTLPVLFKGGTCVLQEHADAALSLSLIERHRITILFDTAHALEEVARSPMFARADLSSLRVIVTGGSQISPSLIETYLRRGLRLRQGYGLTEAAPLALLLDPDEVETHVGAAGRPPLYGAVRVVAPDLEDVAPGVLGELLYRGPNVMQGYWQRPDASTLAFVDDGWLRTGDAAVMAADGVVSIKGRIADVLQCAGRRLDPGPIEEDIRVRAGSECALVQAHPDAAPVAFVVAPPGRSVDLDDVRSICLAHLPPGMRADVRVLDSLPRNANGKVLRRELRVQIATGSRRSRVS